MPVFRPIQVDAKGYFSLKPKDLRHLTQVLRVRPGENFEALLPTGEKARAILVYEGKIYRGKIQEIYPQVFSPCLPVWLALGWIRWPRLEWVVEKATELGAQRLTPLLLQHSQGLPKPSDVPKKLARLKKIAEESLKQCERSEAPHLDPPQFLEQFLSSVEKESSGGTRKIFFWERHDAPKFSADNLSHTKTESWIVAVGPEGGWTQPEVKVLLQYQFEGFSLGSTIYRAETAALYALSCLDFLTMALRTQGP